ncbi:biotin/lipoyl-containing protein [Mesorhizobium newzealandense]|uniref:Biotin/lipoyl-containing protein n=2 Tax=Mesorhizobium TaxID=68287 RepID=A0ABW4U4H7_9HYPH
MRREIIMPALGMAQKTGLIVAWHKAPGDAVKASDILLDVETDKSTMEVEAGHDGYVAALMAGAGDDVPVGSPIAIISSEKPDLGSTPAKAAPSPPATEKLAIPAAVPAVPAAKPPLEKRMLLAAADDGRILASPKIRRLAAERGIDLGRLVAHGMRQPFHAADLDALPPAPAITAPAMLSEIEAMIKPAGLAGMIRLLGEEGGTAGRAALWAAFAASSLRATADDHGQISIRVEQGSTSLHFHDPDQSPLSRLEATPEDGEISLALRDLTGTCVVSTRFAVEPAPVLTLTGDAGHMNLRLIFDASRLTPAAGTALVTGFAARLLDPLRQLL